jgi:protein tyrosine phosphatase (PTP) superfamily phosphohydrolase (DUF442 family)
MRRRSSLRRLRSMKAEVSRPHTHVTTLQLVAAMAEQEGTETTKRWLTESCHPFSEAIPTDFFNEPMAQCPLFPLFPPVQQEPLLVATTPRQVILKHNQRLFVQAATPTTNLAAAKASIGDRRRLLQRGIQPMPRTIRLWALLAALAAVGLLPVVLRTTESAPEETRPAPWAEKLDLPGLPNLHKVNAGLYRGAQPTAEGIEQLKKLGVRAIVNLRSGHSDKNLLGKSSIVVEDIPTTPLGITEDDVVRFLRIATDRRRQPVFVHCQHGADRTGTMCAAYRVVVDGWTKQQAIDEMTKGGFGFHPVWSNLPKFIEKLDVEKVKAKLKE